MVNFFFVKCMFCSDNFIYRVKDSEVCLIFRIDIITDFGIGFDIIVCGINFD